jgi:hypothetical protein
MGQWIVRIHSVPQQVLEVLSHPEYLVYLVVLEVLLDQLDLVFLAPLEDPVVL